MNKQGKCYKCGGFLAVNDAEDAAVCPFCGKPIIVEKAIASYQETVAQTRPGQPKPPANTGFVVVDGVLVGCSCFTEAEIRIPDGVRAR